LGDPQLKLRGRYQEAEEKFLQAWELQKKANKAPSGVFVALGQERSSSLRSTG